ncbi:MAG: U32 family peptidase [Deltaproteobacteria bacterium]|nr:U32 family peptidase [Deltaproteobacteria bacterium]
MRICIATCWDDGFLRRLAALSRPGATVHEVFGSLPRSATGSGRDAALLPPVTAAAVRRHVAAAHAAGIRFNYLMNGACTGGAEFTARGRADLVRQLRWVDSIGADAVTVATPLLVELAREVAPRIEVVISTITHVDSLATVRAYREIGARRITLATRINRDLDLLRSLADKAGLELELLANEMCRFQCPMRPYHYGLMSHASLQHASRPPVEYPHMNCSLERMVHPGELLKARFIRPEDVAAYEERGIDFIKIAGRGRDADWLLRAARAYLERRWDGNLVDLSDLGMWSGDGMDPPRIVVDNRALDGFLGAVAAIDCARECEVSCTLCDQLAERAVRVDGAGPYVEALRQARQAAIEPDGRKLPEMVDRPGTRGRR